MRRRAVISLELADGIWDISGLTAYSEAHVVVRYRGRPIARSLVPLSGGMLRGVDIWLQVCNSIRSGTGLAWVVFNDLAKKGLFKLEGETEPELPPCTILICTRDRPDDLDRCLAAIFPVIGPDVEVIVVDNDSPNERTRRVAEFYPVRYYFESRRGLNWARARGVRLARHELVLFVDDDAVIEPDWILHLRRPFLDPTVGAVTGAVEPIELESEGQILHERFSSFHRGYIDRVYNLTNTAPASCGRAGAGANMGVRKSLAAKYAIFDAELDAGTAAKSGGDLYALYQIARAGYSIVYVPSALVWHRHRRRVEDIPKMLHGYSVGFYCVMLRVFIDHRDWDAPLVAARWFWDYHIAELWRSVFKRSGCRPCSFILTEIGGVFAAPLAYWRCRQRERAIGPLPENEASTLPDPI